MPPSQRADMCLLAVMMAYDSLTCPARWSFCWTMWTAQKWPTQPQPWWRCTTAFRKLLRCDALLSFCLQMSQVPAGQMGAEMHQMDEMTICCD
jgi:hypothetical protein